MRVLTLTIYLLLSMLSYAQETPIAKIHYIFKHINDTTQRDKFLRDEVGTYLGLQSSLYTSVSSNRVNEKLKEIMSNPSFDGNVVLNKNTSTIKSSYVLNITENSLQQIHRVASDEYVLKEEFPVLDWEILEDSKEIGGYACQKAVTNFKGRIYEAWFTTEIPMPFGPWKLNGLPGLILSAADTKQEVIFEFDGFDKIEGTTAMKIQPSVKAISATKEEVEKLEKAFKDNPTAYMESRRGLNSRVVSSGSAVALTPSSSAGGNPSAGIMDPSRIKSISVMNDENYKPSQITNNPIELTP
jgi:GLPGLI family protein